MKCVHALRLGVLWPLCAMVWLLLSPAAHADKPLRNIRVNFLNKNYTVSGVKTVGELQLRIQQKTGIDPLKQGRVMFGVRGLSPPDDLREVGVSNGSHLQLSASNNFLKGERLKRLMEYAAVCFGQVEFCMGMDYVWDVLKALQKIVNSVEFREYMADPKELLDQAEEVRQRLTADPELIDAHMPVENPEFALFRQALNDPSAWKCFVLKYVDRFRHLDLNGPIMAKFKQEVGEAFDRSMEMLNDANFREYLKDEDPGFYDFLQENLDDFSNDND